MLKHIPITIEGDEEKRTYTRGESKEQSKRCEVVYQGGNKYHFATVLFPEEEKSHEVALQFKCECENCVLWEGKAGRPCKYVLAFMRFFITKATQIGEHGRTP